MDTVWRYVSPCQGEEEEEEEEESELHVLAMDSEWDLLLNRLSCLFPSSHSSDSETIEAVRRELNLVDYDGNTALHISLDNKAPLAVIRAFLLEDPMTPLKELKPNFTTVTADCKDVPLASVLNYQGDSALHRATFVSNDPTMIELIAMAYPAVGSEKNRDSKCPTFYACTVDPPNDILNDDDSLTHAETDDEDSFDGKEDSSLSSCAEDFDHETQMAATKGRQLMAKLSNLEGLPSKEGSRPIKLLAPLFKYCPGSFSLTDSYNCTLLHNGVIDKVDYETLEMILNIDSTLTRVQNRFGCTPLQAAARMNSPLPVLKLFVKHFPEAVTLVNGMKYLPLTRSIQIKADMDVLEFLLGINPRAVLQKTIRGLNGFYLLDTEWNAPDVVESIISSPITEDEGNNTDHNEYENWSKRLHLILKSLMPPSENAKMVHAAVRFPTTITSINYMVWRYPEQVREKDSEGKFPLHYAAENGGWYRNCSTSVVNTAPKDKNVLPFLISRHAEAALHIDKNGRLPLHYFLLQERVSDDSEGLDALLSVAPEALEIKDPLTGFYPFQAAAKVSSLATIYRLLRAAPSVLQHNNN